MDLISLLPSCKGCSLTFALLQFVMVKPDRNKKEASTLQAFAAKGWMCINCDNTNSVIK